MIIKVYWGCSKAIHSKCLAQVCWHCHQECELCERNAHRLFRRQNLGDTADSLCGVTDRSSGSRKEHTVCASHSFWVAGDKPPAAHNPQAPDPLLSSEPHCLVLIPRGHSGCGARSTVLFEDLSEPLNPRLMLPASLVSILHLLSQVHPYLPPFCPALVTTTISLLDSNSKIRARCEGTWSPVLLRSTNSNIRGDRKIPRVTRIVLS